MKDFFIILLTLYCFNVAIAQEKEKVSLVTEQQLENLAEKDNAEPEDDSYLQQLDYYRKHPLFVNESGAEELAELKILSGLQIRNFLIYRKLLGKLINVYELQAVPGWDIITIQKLLPFIIVSNDKTVFENIRARWSGGEQTFLFRYGRVLEKSKGHNDPIPPGTSYYTGDRNQLFFRYKYNYKNLLQWGLLGDKDAGEQFFKGAQKQGFDFYSLHFFVKQMGPIKALAIGDFTVNLGQGLIQWQNLAFKKSADVLAVKRESTVLRPYNSPGEYNFHRGIGITLQKKNREISLFASARKISANTVIDSVYNNDDAVSSFQASGYHRTLSEIADRNSLRQTAFGGNIKYSGTSWHAGINAIHYRFSKPLIKPADPYNLFALKGASFTNASIDYSYTFRNMHLFGEAATDNHYKKALLAGMLISFDQKADAAIVYRNIDKAYQSVNANAFTENSLPVNESGLYAGISLRPLASVKIDAYADLFHFPWLKYRVDAPSYGNDYCVRFVYTPNKQVEIYMRYKRETKAINISVTDAVTTVIELLPTQNWRLHASITINKKLTLQNRLELLWYDKNGSRAEEGYLVYADCFYKSFYKAWSGNFRLQYFETNGFNSRVYAYESDLPYRFAVPFYYDKGFRYYLNMNRNVSILTRKKGKNNMSAAIWIKWAQSIYVNKTSTGTGLDEIPGNKKSEIRFQFVVTW